MTLTQSNKVKDPARAYKLLPAQWDVFRKLMQRANPDGWRYIAFVEGQPHRDYMPHFHIIASSHPLPQTIKQSDKTALANVARRCGFGWVCDYQVVTDKHAAAYVAKYASKVAPNMPKGFRRVRTSQGFADMPDAIQPSLILPMPNEKLAQYLIRAGDITGYDPDDLMLEIDKARVDFDSHAAERIAKVYRINKPTGENS